MTAAGEIADPSSTAEVRSYLAAPPSSPGFALTRVADRDVTLSQMPPMSGVVITRSGDSECNVHETMLQRRIGGCLPCK